MRKKGFFFPFATPKCKAISLGVKLSIVYPPHTYTVFVFFGLCSEANNVKSALIFLCNKYLSLLKPFFWGAAANHPIIEKTFQFSTSSTRIISTKPPNHILPSLGKRGRTAEVCTQGKKGLNKVNHEKQSDTFQIGQGQAQNQGHQVVHRDQIEHLVVRFCQKVHL